MECYVQGGWAGREIGLAIVWSGALQPISTSNRSSNQAVGRRLSSAVIITSVHLMGCLLVFISLLV